MPIPVIYDMIKENGEIKVFGNFYSFIYYKNGNTLEEDGGSEMPACFHLKKANGSYDVVQVEKPETALIIRRGLKNSARGIIFDIIMSLDEIRWNFLRNGFESYYDEQSVKYYETYGWRQDVYESVTETICACSDDIFVRMLFSIFRMCDKNGVG